MKLLDAHSGTTSKTIDFQGSFNALHFKISNPAGYGTLDNVKAVLHIQSPKGGRRHTIFDEVSLIRIAEICSMDKESSIKLTQTSTFSGASPEVLTFAAATAVEFQVDLTADGGAIMLAPGEKWYLTLTGLTAGDTYHVWGHESSTPTKSPIQYEVLSTTGNKTAMFNLAGADRAWIQKNVVLSSVDIKDNGGQVRVELDELSAMIRNGFGQVYTLDTTLGAGGNIIASYSINEGLYGYMLPTDGIDAIQVNSSAAGTAVEVILARWDNISNN